MSEPIKMEGVEEIVAVRCNGLPELKAGSECAAQTLSSGVARVPQEALTLSQARAGKLPYEVLG
jgi:hypothetical protein